MVVALPALRSPARDRAGRAQCLLAGAPAGVSDPPGALGRPGGRGGGRGLLSASHGSRTLRSARPTGRAAAPRARTSAVSSTAATPPAAAPADGLAGALSAAQREAAARLPGRKLSAQELFRIVSPTLFVVTTRDSRGAARTLGSAIAVASDLVVTNAHVVEGGASIRVTQGEELVRVGARPGPGAGPLPLAHRRASRDGRARAGLREPAHRPAGLRRRRARGARADALRGAHLRVSGLPRAAGRPDLGADLARVERGRASTRSAVSWASRPS